MFLRFTSCALNGPPLSAARHTGSKSKKNQRHRFIQPVSRLEPKWHRRTILQHSCQYVLRRHSTSLNSAEASPSGRMTMKSRSISNKNLSIPSTFRAATMSALVSWSALFAHAAAASFPRCHPPPLTSPAVPATRLPAGRGRSGLTPPLPKAHLDIGQSENYLCLEAASKTAL